MKILLDEDVPVQLLDALQQVLDLHDVHHVDRLQWKSKKDHNLFADAPQRGYEALITNDKGQINNPEECRDIRDSGMHHIRYDQDTSKGKEGLALAMGAILAAIVPLVKELDGTPQRLVHIAAIAPHKRGRRFEVTDPVTDPPSYWPRSGPAPRRPRKPGRRRVPRS